VCDEPLPSLADRDLGRQGPGRPPVLIRVAMTLSLALSQFKHLHQVEWNLVMTSTGVKA
jgi:hypothetical protein